MLKCYIHCYYYYYFKNSFGFTSGRRENVWPTCYCQLNEFGWGWGGFAPVNHEWVTCNGSTLQSERCERGEVRSLCEQASERKDCRL